MRGWKGAGSAIILYLYWSLTCLYKLYCITSKVYFIKTLLCIAPSFYLSLPYITFPCQFRIFLTTFPHICDLQPFYRSPSNPFDTLNNNYRRKKNSHVTKTSAYLEKLISQGTLCTLILPCSERMNAGHKRKKNMSFGKRFHS